MKRTGRPTLKRHRIFTQEVLTKTQNTFPLLVVENLGEKLWTGLVGHSDWTKPWHETPTTDVFCCLGWKPLPSSHHRCFFPYLYCGIPNNKTFVCHKKTRKGDKNPTAVLPKCSIYGIFTFIYPQNYPNVDKYTIHLAHLLLVINILILYPIQIWCLNEKMSKALGFPDAPGGVASKILAWHEIIHKMGPFCCGTSRVSQFGVTWEGPFTYGAPPKKRGVTANCGHFTPW